MAEPGERGVAQPCRRVGRHDVLDDRHRARPLHPLDLTGEAVEQSAAPRHRRHLHTLGREAFGDGAADPDAGAGDQRGLAHEPQIHGLPSLLAAAMR